MEIGFCEWIVKDQEWSKGFLGDYVLINEDSKVCVNKKRFGLLSIWLRYMLSMY